MKSAIRRYESLTFRLTDLDAADASAGSPSWVNNGTLGDFVEVGDPVVTNDFGPPAVSFNLDGRNDDAYQSPVEAPAGLVGPDPTRSIEVWVLNEAFGAEETLVSWGKRGGPDGSNMSFNYGNHGNFGAVGHWGGTGPDLGWVDNNFTAGSYPGTGNRNIADDGHFLDVTLTTAPIP